MKMRRKYITHTFLVGMQNGTTTPKKTCQYLTKLNTHSPYYSAIALVGICSREMKAVVHTKTCIQLFIAALLIIENTGNILNVFQWGGA